MVQILKALQLKLCCSPQLKQKEKLLQWSPSSPWLTDFVSMVLTEVRHWLVLFNSTVKLSLLSYYVDTVPVAVCHAQGICMYLVFREPHVSLYRLS